MSECNDWFVRESKKIIIEGLGIPIAKLVEKLGIDYVNDLDSVSECINTLLEISDLTEEEMIYAIEYIQNICSLEGLVNKGLMTRVKGGYRLTKKGKARRNLLLGQSE